MVSLRTVARAHRVEIPRVKGSRFLAAIGRVRSEAEALAFVDGIRAEWPGATHYAYGFRIDPAHQRASDDGEVRGTAGRPILDRLVGADLQQTVLVVVRYYGGTKLGTGGLVRAYGAAAAAVLDAVDQVVEAATRLLRIRVSHKLVGPVEGLVTRFGGQITAVDYGAAVTLTLSVPEEQADALLEGLRDRSAGQLELLPEAP